MPSTGEEFRTQPANPFASPAAKRPVAWQPLTPKGVAAFALARFNRLFWVQGVVAALAAASVVWFLYANWCPVIRTAMHALPSEGSIRDGRLEYPSSGPEVLAENPYLGMLVRLDEFSLTSAGADVRIEFRPRTVQVCSLLGCMVRAYSKGVVPFTAQEAVPWWQAWETPWLAIVFVVVALALLSIWNVLAALACLPVRTYCYFADRSATVAGSWRLAGAAALPGAMFLAGALVLYGVGAIDLLRFLFAVPVHLLIFLVYLVWSPLRLPFVPEVRPPDQNPFATASAQAGAGAGDAGVVTGPTDGGLGAGRPAGGQR